MSDALTGTEASSPEKKKRLRKKREVSRRMVLTLPDEMSLYVHTHYREEATTPVGFARILMMEGLRARGLTTPMLRAAFHTHEAERFSKMSADEIAAEEAASQEDIDDDDE